MDKILSNGVLRSSVRQKLALLVLRKVGWLWVKIIKICFVKTLMIFTQNHPISSTIFIIYITFRMWRIINENSSLYISSPSPNSLASPLFRLATPFRAVGCWHRGIDLQSHFPSRGASTSGLRPYPSIATRTRRQRRPHDSPWKSPKKSLKPRK